LLNPANLTVAKASRYGGYRQRKRQLHTAFRPDGEGVPSMSIRH
jgi:hypothetical protein